MRPTDSNLTGQAKDPLRDALALLIKELIWRYLVRFRPTKRPICLYASRRSGSTLLMEMIGVNPGVMFSDQPFGAYTASSANLNRLPVFPYGQIAEPDAEEQRILHDYITGLLSGRIRANVPWKLWSREFHWHNDRICLKITDAKSVLDWIAREFAVDTLVMTRHPIAQALSVAQAGWLPTGKGLLRNAGFVQRWLNDELEAYSWDLYATGSPLQRRVLDWSLENLPLLAMLPHNSSWLYVSYEDLVQYTRAVVDGLCDKLQLPCREQMVRRAARPSRSTRSLSSAERQQWIHQQDRSRLLNSWRSKLDQVEVQSCFRVLDRFQIDLYRPDCWLPDHHRIGRQGFASGPDGSPVLTRPRTV